MASNTDHDNSVLLVPLKHIGAQDISGLHGGCTKNGFLRKQGKLERIFKCMTWRQRYVVISRGCLYIFKNEFSRAHCMAVSLKSYNKTLRTTNIPRMPFVFRVVPHDPTTGSILMFSCPDEANQKSWMGAIKKDLLKANEVDIDDIDVSVDDYVYLEKDVRTHKEEADIQATANREIDPEKDYSVIKEVDTKRPVPPSTSSLPSPARKIPPQAFPKPKAATFGANQQNTDLKNKTTSPGPATGQKNAHFKKRVPTPKPQKQPEDDEPKEPVIDRTSYLFKGSDRSQVEDLLLSKTEGTFLVRESRNDGREVLSVNIGDSLKEYKIYVKDNKCTIDHKNCFDSTEELLRYYHKNSLPNKNVKLTKAYLLQSAGYVNQRFAK